MTAHRTARAARFDNPRVGETGFRVARHIHAHPHQSVTLYDMPTVIRGWDDFRPLPA